MGNEYYDFFNYICFRDEKGKYAFRALSQSQIKNSREIRPKELIAVRNVYKKRETWYEKAKHMNPWKGLLFFILSSIVMTMDNYTTKIIFIANPTTSVVKLNFTRTFIALILTLVRTYNSMKADLWDPFISLGNK